MEFLVNVMISSQSIGSLVGLAMQTWALAAVYVGYPFLKVQCLNCW